MSSLLAPNVDLLGFDVNDKPLLILGIGNILPGDEGVGVRVVQALRGRRSPAEAEAVDGGTSGADPVLEHFTLGCVVAWASRPCVAGASCPCSSPAHTTGGTPVGRMGKMPMPRIRSTVKCSR